MEEAGIEEPSVKLDGADRRQDSGSEMGQMMFRQRNARPNLGQIACKSMTWKASMATIE